MKSNTGIILTGRDSYPSTPGRARRPASFATGGGNRLIPTATPTWDRKQTWLLDYDVHRNVTNYGRRVMLTLGRHLYCAYDVVRGAVDEIANAAAKSFTPEYIGPDNEFEEQLSDWIPQHDRVCDLAGWPYNHRTYRRLLVQSIFLDGDMGTIFVRGANNQPQLQIIPSHRIGSADAEPYVEGGPYDGARIISGVILGDYSNPIAYRILTGDSGDFESHVDIPSDRMILSFIPQFPGLVRGFSRIGYSAWNFQDCSESDRWELLAQKAGAGRVFQEWNQEGEPPPGADFVTGPNAGATAAGTPTGLWSETIEGGINSYFKSSDPNSQIKAVTFDRPSSNQQQFHNSKIREALYAAGWSSDFSLNLDPKIGGAALRILIDKLNDTIEAIGDDVVEPAARRFDAWRIPAAMADGILKFTPDWWKLNYTRAARKTPDAKYDSDLTIQEVRAGIKTRSRAIAERGGCEEDLREENEKSIMDLLTRSQRIADAKKIPLELALSLMELVTPNGNLPAVGKAQADPPGAT